MLAPTLTQLEQQDAVSSAGKASSSRKTTEEPLERLAILASEPRS
jgi:hypothetical protein